MSEKVSNVSYFPNNFYLGGPSWTLVEIWFFLSVSLLAIAANILSLWILCRKSFKLKLNVRLLLICCSFCYSLRCFHYIMIGAYYFRLYYLEPLGMWDKWCSLAMYPYVVADNGVYLFAFMISLDRAWSTYLVGPKLTNHNLSSITIRSMTLCCLPLVALTLFFYSGLSHDRPSFLPYCAIVQIMKPDFVLAGNIFILTTQCLTCLIYSILQIINAKKYASLLINTALYSLRLRARYSSNLNVTQWLMPISVFHCAYSFVIFATYNAIRLGRPIYFQEATLIIQRTIFTALAIESLTHPVMLIGKNQSMADFIGSSKFWPHKMKQLLRIEETKIAPAGKSIKLATIVSKKRAIVDYRIDPRVQDLILTDIWSMNVVVHQ